MKVVPSSAFDRGWTWPPCDRRMSAAMKSPRPGSAAPGPAAGGREDPLDRAPLKLPVALLEQRRRRDDDPERPAQVVADDGREELHEVACALDLAPASRCFLVEAKRRDVGAELRRGHRQEAE